MAKSTPGERLRLARKSKFKGVSGRKVAEMLGVHPSVLNAHERGTRKIDTEDAERYSRRFSVRSEWLLLNKGEMPATFEDDEPAEPRTQIVGYVGAGAKAHYYNVSQGGLDDVQRPSFATDKTVAVEIRGDSMGKWVDRWLVYYDDVRSPITDDLYGKTCVLGLANDQVVIKTVRPGSQPGLFNLIAEKENESINDAKVLWGAKVLNIMQR